MDEGALEIPGFEDSGFEATLAHSGARGDADDDVVPDLRAEHICSRVGDLYRLGEHRLLCADATAPVSYVRLMNGDLARTVITDFPYHTAASRCRKRQGRQMSSGLHRGLWGRRTPDTRNSFPPHSAPSLIISWTAQCACSLRTIGAWRLFSSQFGRRILTLRYRDLGQRPRRDGGLTESASELVVIANGAHSRFATASILAGTVAIGRPSGLMRVPRSVAPRRRKCFRRPPTPKSVDDRGCDPARYKKATLCWICIVAPALRLHPG